MAGNNKHFLNDSSTLVIDSLEGLCAMNPHLSIDRSNKVVHVTAQDRSHVALLCGGGSGHEPAHAGFVGKGMLTAAVCGNIFASPNASQVRRGIDLVDNEQGTLIVVKNYTGDVLNFGLSKEQYAALHPDKATRLKFVIVGDDVAVGKTQGDIVGRRGLAGTCLVYKIAGALASTGASLDDVYSVAQWVASRIVSIGVGSDHCHVPGTAATESHLKADEIEIGMGIHNESGHKRLSPAPPLKELIPNLLELLTSTTDSERSFVPFQGKGDRVVLLVNNLGGLSELELGGVVNQARVDLEGKGIKIERVLAGTFMTSLNMPGFSITLLLLPSGNENAGPSAEHILDLLDADTTAPGWRWSSKSAPSVREAVQSPTTAKGSVGSRKIISSSNDKAFTEAITRACKNLIAAEPEITRMDTIAGDGDCGLTLKSGASGVLQHLESGQITGKDVVGATIDIARVAEEHMGGTSGALYSIFFSALAQGIEAAPAGDEKIMWSSALQYALEKLYTYTRARRPSRTLVDPLAAFVEKIQEKQENSFALSVKAAQSAAEGTRDLAAKAGRSAYVGVESLRDERVADPGAWGVKVILEGLLG